MIHTEPNWKSYLVETTEPIFTPEQCDIISRLGRSMPPQNAQVGEEVEVSMILKLEYLT
jgi:hypothetical protein